MRENRIDPRFKTIGRARIADILEGDVLLKNLSITGCCLECPPSYYNEKIKTFEKYTIDIKPEKIASIAEFHIEVECRWIRKRDSLCEIGFQVVASPKGRGFQNYVDYLTYHSSII